MRCVYYLSESHEYLTEFEWDACDDAVRFISVVCCAANHKVILVDLKRRLQPTKPSTADHPGIEDKPVPQKRLDSEIRCAVI
jgi:hypothetical protein